MKDTIDAILRRPQAEYLERIMPPRDPLLAEMEHYAAEHGHPIADPEVAQLLRILVSMKQPRRVVEVGTNIGYSVVVMGRELEPEATIETMEIDPAIVRVADEFIGRAALPCTVVIHEGAALEVLGTLDDEIDFAFIDCVKTEYVDYLDLLLTRMQSGGIIVADNVLWKGQVAEGAREPKQEASTAALRAFNERLMNDPQLYSTILPTGDGVSISVVR